MVSYLLNVSAIWLLSLLCFDIFLKRETYHAMNRIYLLSTLLLGMIIPLMTWPAAAETTNYIYYIRQPLYYPVDHARQTVVQTVAIQNSPSFHWTKLIEWLYLSGVILSCAWLLKNLMQLARYYYSGTWTMSGKWCIVETGKAHGPFSFAHIIFISSKKNYSAEQLQIIMKHEQQHAKLLHLADMILLQLLQVFLWFNPLVYLYHKRLLLVHEYQADAATARHPQDYGKFLIEQSLLQHAPALTHSFNRKPIHSRIHMLTHSKTPQIHLMKLLIIIPVIMIAFVCCTNNSHNVTPGKNKTGGTITKVIHFKGNEITRKETPLGDFNMTTDAVDSVFTRYPKSIELTELNGKKIMDRQNVDTEPEIIGSKDLATYLFTKIKADLERLDDGYYACFIQSLVIDENGKTAYYDIDGIDATQKQSAGLSFKVKNNKAALSFDGVQKSAPEEMQPADQSRIDKKINAALDEARFSPAVAKGQKVPFLNYSFPPFNTRLYHVQNHVATLEDFDTSASNKDTLRLAIPLNSFTQ